MPEKVSAQSRREVSARAGRRCEYCLMPEWALLAGCEVDHIVSRKHGGVDGLANLAFSCARCNRAKGSDVGSIATSTGAFVRLFNPRIDRWNEHFSWAGARIHGRTTIGEVTAALLRMNGDDRVAERHLLQKLGEFPTI